MDLAEIQSLFAASLDAPHPPPAEARFTALLERGGGRSAARRVGVYRDGSGAARMNALEAIYPVCRAVVGERCFRALARDHVYAVPSRRSDLNHYGEQFPERLAHALALPDFVGLEYLPDLARLEWHWHGLYYAPDDPVFDAQAFARDAARDADTIRFRVSASLRLLASPWPVADLWKKHRAQDVSGPLEIGEGDRLALWRQGLDCRLEPVDADLFALLQAMAQGRCLGAMGASGLCVERLGEALAQGWIVAHEPGAAGN